MAPDGLQVEAILVELDSMVTTLSYSPGLQNRATQTSLCHMLQPLFLFGYSLYVFSVSGLFFVRRKRGVAQMAFVQFVFQAYGYSCPEREF